MPAGQSTIIGPTTATPAATDTKSAAIDATPHYTVAHFDSGRYLNKVVVSLGGANTGSTGSYFAA